MEVTAHSLIHNGFLKLHSSTLEGKTYEYVETRDSVSTILVEQQDNPLADIITLGLQFRVGAFVNELRQAETYTLASGYIDEGETTTEAAHRESEEEFGARGHVYKLGGYFNSPSVSTHVSNLFWMDVKEWHEPTDLTEGIRPVKLTLEQILNMVKSPFSVMSMPLSTAVLLYAAYRGV